jgi:hypothetical protein
MAGQYEVVVIYTAKSQATFKLSVGTFERIKSGTAPSLTAQLPALVRGRLSNDFCAAWFQHYITPLTCK